MTDTDNLEDDFLFIDDSDDDQAIEGYKGETWKILIADDDTDIHSVTQLALSELTVLGRKLEYLHAYSGAQTCQLIEENSDIALVLLDVVMESDHAGLDVIKYVRDELQRHEIRIVLRTGQPGYAPEEDIIKNYDINDYKTKTELTRRKLVTSVYAAIRSYKQITVIHQGKNNLENIIRSTAQLLEYKNIHEYVDSALAQLQVLFNQVSTSVFCARGQGIITDVDDLNLYVIGQNGFSTSMVNQSIDSVNHEALSRMSNVCFHKQAHVIEDKYVVLFISRGKYRACIYASLSVPFNSLDLQFVELFLSNIAIGYENVHLFQKLSHAAFKDWLTELPNRLEFVNLLDDFSQSPENCAVATLIDIKHFRDINDGLGQDIGNLLLNAVAERLININAGCQLARVGADVFGIIGHEDLINEHSLSKLFLQPFQVGEHLLPINVCFGFCTKENAGSRGINVLNQINIALNLAKKESHYLPYAYYVKDIEEQTLWRLSMIRELRNDFAENRLALWYQPQLSLTTGKVIGAEALLRWIQPNGMHVSPNTFIPLAEYSGLIIDIGDWVIDQACEQLKILTQHGFGDVSISVNVSVPQFRRLEFADSIIDKIDIHQVSSRNLELEITESILMDDPDIIVESLTKLKEHGVNIALDDFGTGYSSLSYLQQLPLDRLKIDRSFVNDIADPDKSMLVDMIINLGKKMNLTVIAEGIENVEQEKHLLAQGCDEVQGFYYAKPMPEEEFLSYLKSKNQS